MSQPSSSEEITAENQTLENQTVENQTVEPGTGANPGTQEPPPSYVKLAMRNMVRKGRTSLKHFALTTIGLLAFLVGVAYLGR
jgi:hypothetical protein